MLIALRGRERVIAQSIYDVGMERLDARQSVSRMQMGEER